MARCQKPQCRAAERALQGSLIHMSNNLEDDKVKRRQTGVVNAAGFVGGAVMRTLHISGWQACIRRTIRF